MPKSVVAGDKLILGFFLNFLLDFSVPKSIVAVRNFFLLDFSMPKSVVAGEKIILGIFLNFLLDFSLPKSIVAERKIGLGFFISC